MILHDEQGKEYRVKFQYDSIELVDLYGVPRTTVCRLETDDETIIGEAACSHRDQFVKRVGRKLAFTRAISELPREKRAALWKGYLERVAA